VGTRKEESSSFLKKRTKKLLLCFGFIFLLSFLYLTLCMVRYVNAYDEGIILFGANRVMDGDIPHRDFYANYGPAQFYIIAGLFKLFGPSILIERVWDTLVRSLLAVLVFAVADRFTRRGIALLATAASVTWLGFLGFYSYTVFPALAASLASVLFLIRPARSPRPRLGPLWAGLCMGLAALFRYDIGVAGFACGFCILILQRFVSHADNAGASPLLRAGLAFGAGFGIVTVPVAIAFGICGAMPDLIFDAFAFPAQFYAKTRSLPFPTLAALRAWPTDFSVYIPLFIIISGTATILDIVRAQRDGLRRRPLHMDGRLLVPLVALLLLTIVYFAKGSVRVSPVHMAMALIVSLTLLAVLAQPIPARGWFSRALLAACVLLAATYTYFCAVDGYHRAVENIAWATTASTWQLPATWRPPPEGTCRMPAGLERLACFPVSPDMAETIRYVQQNTSPNAPIFVGLARHDKIFANDVLLYFAVNRKSATKWHHFDPGLQTSYSIQQEMVAELRRAKPKLIVLEARWTDAQEPNDSANSSGVTLLDDYIKSAFKPVAWFGRNTVLQAVSQ
jgi:hypothetical protein